MTHSNIEKIQMKLPPPRLPAWHITPSNLLYTKQFQSQDGIGGISEMLFNSTKPFFGNWD